MENRTFSSPTLGAPGAVGRDQEQAGAAPVTGRAAARSAPVAPSRSLRARRRRPAVIAMAAALIAAGGLGGAALYNSTGKRIAVLALARDVPYGQPLTAADLVVARIASDPALAPVNAADLDIAVGQRATTDLHQGALLLAADLTRQLVVQPGMQEVGLPVHPSQLPADGVQVGQQIVLVQVGDQPSPTGGGAAPGPQTMNAVVAQLGPAGGDGSRVIDLAVPPAQAPTLAQWAAAGHFQVILAPKAGAAAGASAGPSPAVSPSGSPAPGGSGGSAA
ncbi:SAF domain-containing protein [Kitasatospora sp. NBC_01287]|uniref:SAF domain-containing protein n=1 Tax=Kitasatospora sp. NBC_01287 TaxID=2903573 RepID=UPI0022583B55|nr:SAF domain-containing protein [Kitasatospora sp. NBC_01287]MCX4745245.1 SAF domain-containing protein [Kitasatospora sp. NBC_01287]